MSMAAIACITDLRSLRAVLGILKSVDPELTEITLSSRVWCSIYYNSEIAFDQVPYITSKDGFLQLVIEFEGFTLFEARN